MSNPSPQDRASRRSGAVWSFSPPTLESSEPELAYNVPHNPASLANLDSPIDSPAISDSPGLRITCDSSESPSSDSEATDVPSSASELASDNEVYSDDENIFSGFSLDVEASAGQDRGASASSRTGDFYFHDRNSQHTQDALDLQLRELKSLMSEANQILKAYAINDRSTLIFEQKLDQVEHDMLQALNKSRRIKAKLAEKRMVLLSAVSSRLEVFLHSP
ncbi:hypothetical protein V5O48_005262 [Marasmius crinis-equi]|uniref:Uncharacterized protein n=1 Tax=Marasmius crinis-equi TaxID=585013 RepID=A0ABR3FMS5_9AGAR